MMLSLKQKFQNQINDKEKPKVVDLQQLFVWLDKSSFYFEIVYHDERYHYTCIIFIFAAKGSNFELSVPHSDFQYFQATFDKIVIQVVGSK